MSKRIESFLAAPGLSKDNVRLELLARSHVICPDGYIRDSVYFSITSKEWPQVKRQLASILR